MNPQNIPPDTPQPGHEPDFDGIDLSELPPVIEAKTRQLAKEAYMNDLSATLAAVPRPINWRTLPPHDLEHELLDLNAWVDWLRHEYGLPAQVIPPMWHRHPELLWELSALKQHWLFCFDPQAKGNQALAWHHDFAVARERLRDWVTISGTRLDRDRPTRQTVWPGEEPGDPIEDIPIIDRDAEFVEFVMADVQARREAEDAFYRDLDPDTGEVS